MGEVYRARDSRLSREVAIKVLPASVAEDRDRLRRFELEARAAGALNHPNVVTVFDFGSHDGTHFVVSELLEGDTLRERMRSGDVTVAKAVDYIVQVTRGLAAAHQKGIVHRDLKPENIFVTRDSRVKILDFGLAKLQAMLTGEAGESVQASMPTMSGPGTVIGTIGYMAPEQVRGFTADHRADIFACGAILYELLAGRRAFQGDSAADVMTAILREDPQPLSEARPNVPPALERVVRRCLEKKPEDRFQSCHDLGLALEAVSDVSSVPSPGSAQSRPARAARLPQTGSDDGPRISLGGSALKRLRPWALAVGTATAVLAAGLVIANRTRTVPQPTFHQVTFRISAIDTARFTRDGSSVIYSAAWEGRPAELFETRLGSPEARPLGMTRTEVLSISPAAELAILMGPSFGLIMRPPHNDSTVRNPLLQFGTLGRVPIGGGARRELMDNVLEADWAPDGENLAVVRFVNGKNRIEYPIGTTIFEASTWLTQLRLSPDGRSVAFQRDLEVFLARPPAAARPLNIDKVSELAWSADGHEIWFTRIVGGATEVRAVTPNGEERLVANLPGDIALYDISREGKLLLGRTSESSEILGRFPGEATPRDLSWFDRSSAVALSRDGSTILFEETGYNAAKLETWLYVRGTDGSPAKRLGKLQGLALSPDGRMALGADGAELVVVPTGTGQPVRVAAPGLWPDSRGDFFPDGRRIFAMMESQREGQRAYVLDPSGGSPRAFSPLGTRRGILSPDGRFVVALAADQGWYLYPTDGGPAAGVVSLQPGEEPTQWRDDSRALYVHGADRVETGDKVFVTRIYTLDPWSGKRELLKEIPPISQNTGGGIGRIFFAQNGSVCVLTHYRYSSELFIAEGLR